MKQQQKIVSIILFIYLAAGLLAIGVTAARGLAAPHKPVTTNVPVLSTGQLTTLNATLLSRTGITPATGAGVLFGKAEPFEK